MTGFGRAGRDWYLKLLGLIGDDWTWRGCHRVSSSAGERGDEARTGEDDSGDETAGRLSQEGTGFGVNDSILFGATSSVGFCINKEENPELFIKQWLQCIRIELLCGLR